MSKIKTAHYKKEIESRFNRNLTCSVKRKIMEYCLINVPVLHGKTKHMATCPNKFLYFKHFFLLKLINKVSI